MPPETDDLVVDIPTDIVEVPASGAPPARAFAPEKTTPAPDDTAERLVRLEREREVAARERDEERAARVQAERFAREQSVARATAEETVQTREQQVMNAHWARIHSDRDHIVAAIATAEAREQSAKDAFRAAREAGSADKEAEALSAIADSRAMMSQLEQGKIAAERQIEDTRRALQERAASRQPQPRADDAGSRVAADPQPQPAPVTPDAWIDGVRPSLGDTNANWLREHKEFVTDAKLNRKLLRFADDYADDHGVAALKSDQFRQALDGKFFPDKEEPAPVQAQERPRPRATSSAPVSRGSQFFSSANPNGTQVRLPPRLASFVKAAGLNPTDYALAAVADIKAGKLPKDFLDPDYPHDGA